MYDTNIFKRDLNHFCSQTHSCSSVSVPGQVVERHFTNLCVYICVVFCFLVFGFQYQCNWLQLIMR